MFEIDGSHISLLSDTDLRTLVARLCEAELRKAGWPVSAVTAGGDQNAKDGGLDVRVDLSEMANPSGFIPRQQTGYQVKKSDMQPKAIAKEMRPKDKLRPVIKELASVSGAYIIVSAKGHTTDSPLKQRRKAMREALADLPNAESLFLDFYDRDRLARWVRDHHGLIAWVRERIGQPIQGWQAYGDWSKSGSVDSTFLLDDQCRVHDNRTHQVNGLSVEQGIQRIRGVLNQPKGVVRLVGLSGTGKTRLVQALFDDRVGEQALDPAIAHYTDEADAPVPSPRELMRRLIQEERRAIVIIDNCLPGTHRSLTSLCAEAASMLSLITVEFDVGEDEPEKTEVFRLEPASEKIIAELIRQREPQVSQADRSHIAKTSISGGNARMALALARTVQQGESIAKLTDKVLFERLFYQGKPQDKTLLMAAEVCSLVYSFDGQTLEGEAAELPLLAGLVNMPAAELYRHVAELYRRGLVQRRSRWRAVLPQALALWLARRALQDIPPDLIEVAMRKGPAGRLLRSFSRRIGYLHDSEEAHSIVRGWLSTGGFLADLGKLSQLGVDMFRNVAPVLPELALATLDRAIDGNGINLSDRYDSGRSTWISILKSLAYDAELFPRAALLLARIACAETENHNYNSARGPFRQLFQLHLSGTHTSIEQRLRIIQTLLYRESATEQALAMEALDELLNASHFSGHGDFEFGARPRDFGWQPKLGIEVITWYRAVINLAQDLALSDGPHSEKARSLLAKRFRGLWMEAGVIDELEAMAKTLSANKFWPEGWIAVREIMGLRNENVTPDILARLQDLEKALRPVGLLQTARAYLFSEPWYSLDIADDETDGDYGNPEQIQRRITQAGVTTESLGRDIAKKPELLDELMPDIVRHPVYRGWDFGRGLASGAENLTEIWNRLIRALAEIPQEQRDVAVQLGFLHVSMALNPVLTESFLDTAVSDPILGPLFPLLQTAVDIGDRGTERLEASLKLGLASKRVYQVLAYGRAADTVPSISLRRLIAGIASLPDGFDCALKILQMRLHSFKTDNKPVDAELVQCGRELLLLCDFERRNFNNLDEYRLAEIVDLCLVGEDAADVAVAVCRKLASAMSGYLIFLSAYHKFLESLFRAQTVIALDEFVGQEISNPRLSNAYDDELNQWNPLISTPMESLLSWAKIDQNIRCPNLASVIPLFAKGEQAAGLAWSAIALEILDLAPDRHAVLNQYIKRFWPSSWSGSKADLLESYRSLPQALFFHEDPQVASWARGQDAELAKEAERERAREKQTDERFE